MLKYLLLSCLLVFNLHCMQEDKNNQVKYFSNVTRINFSSFLGSVILSQKSYPQKENLIVVQYQEPESFFQIHESRSKGILDYTISANEPIQFNVYSAGKPLAVFRDGKKMDMPTLTE